MYFTLTFINVLLICMIMNHIIPHTHYIEWGHWPIIKHIHGFLTDRAYELECGDGVGDTSLIGVGDNKRHRNLFSVANHLNAP